MSRKRVEPLKSRGRKKRELDRTVSLIEDYHNKYLRELRSIIPTAELKKEKNDLDPNNEVIRKIAADYFKKNTDNLRKEIKGYISLGYSEEVALERILPKAYANVRAASDFLWKKPHFRSQLIGGILLNEGYVSEMATGEGKTLTATLPVYLNALTGKGAHVITPNNYLASRDSKEMGELYELMGLSCGLVEDNAGKIDKEVLEERVRELLKEKIKDYALAKKINGTEEEIVNAFFSDYNNRDVILETRKDVRETLKIEKILRKKQAYRKDITYGSAEAFAFDYLFDDVETDRDKLVQRPGEPNFAIIDEVDAVLFDNATTPFILSGEQKDEELEITKEEKEEALKIINLVNGAIAAIYKENQKLKGKLVTEIAKTIDFEHLTEAKEYEMLEMTQVLVIDRNTKEYHLTELGEILIFKYFYARDITRILDKNKEKIISMKFQNQPMYRENYDYEIKNNHLVMEPRAFAYLVTSGQIPELTRIYHKFGLNELIQYHQEIDNSIKAWFILSENKEYKLSSPKDAKTENEKMVSLVVDGRTAEGRTYSKGLQQAIEAKEKIKKPHIKIRDTEIKNIVASIPAASFFARYEKMGGMTGTAAVNAFKNLYGLETYEVPRNKPKAVTDHGDVFCTSREAKNEAIFREVLTSYKKGQPVLISTTSIKESIALYKYLDKRFKQENISVNIPILNANVENLEEEANIISKAGMVRAITISTEMAGRGTDIKLGGEVPEVSALIDQAKEELFKRTFRKMKIDGKINEEDRESIEQLIKKTINKKEEAVIKEAKRLQKVIKAKKEIQKANVEAAGGLKVIGSGHFSFSRVDNQVKGRCGRQGERGEVIFFNDEEDLIRVGVPREEIDKLKQKARNSQLRENPERGYLPIGDLVYKAQMRAEEMERASIEYNQQMEIEISAHRKFLREQREKIKRSGNYIDGIASMIELTADYILEASSNNDYAMFINDKTRLRSANIDYKKLSSLANEFLGINLDQREIRRFKKVGQLSNYIAKKSKIVLDHNIKEKGKNNFNNESKEIVDRLLYRTWADFEVYVDELKNQYSLNNIATKQDIPKEQRTNDLNEAFYHCFNNQMAKIVRETINPNYKTKTNSSSREEVAVARVTPEGVKRVEDDYDKKVDMDIEKHKKEVQREKDREMRIKNLKPLPRLFAVVNKIALNRKSKNLVIGETDEVETVDFDSGKKM